MSRRSNLPKPASLAIARARSSPQQAPSPGPPCASDCGTQRPAADPAGYRADAEAFVELVNRRYAYLDRLPRGRFALTRPLAFEASTVHDRDSLLRFLERAVALLVDHHAITGAAQSNSWALVPSYSDLWIKQDGAGYVVSDVREAMPAAGRVAPGDQVLAVDGVAIEAAIEAWWRDLGVDEAGQDAREFAARVLLAGRRDRPRLLTIRHGGGAPLTLALPNVYAARPSRPSQQAVSTTRSAQVTRIVFHDSLGEGTAIDEFDAAMAAVPSGDRIVIDLTDTPSGGTSTVARAIIGWFVTQPQPYQMHASPEEFRETGIARQWAEYVAPRAGKHFAGPVSVRVGRWTGSMGEGLAVGLAALGVPVCGGSMAGLLGAIEDHRLEHSGLVVKFATERLTTLAGTPRELFRPLPPGHEACRPI
jgi:carboxyl-terminal processing protease